MLQLVTLTVDAQRKKERTDTLAVYREFAALGRWYMQQPLQMNVHFGYKSTPAIAGHDSMETDMQLFYGKNDFYMQAEGMEQIANDSLVIMVNNETKMINLFPNDGQAFKKFQQSMAMFAPDSSLQRLAQQFTAGLVDKGQGRRTIILQSRSRVTGTDQLKEIVSMTYDATTHQPLAYHHTTRSLTPVDSLVYSRLAGNSAYNGRLVSTKVKEYNLFWVVKENITDCRFNKISHKEQHPPAREHDRVVRAANGGYEPAKGFENYLVNTEW